MDLIEFKLQILQACDGNTQFANAFYAILEKALSTDGQARVELIDKLIHYMDRFKSEKQFSSSCKSHDRLPMTVAAH